MYVDLDFECLRPFDRLLSRNGSEKGPDSVRTPLYQSAYFGQMGRDPTFIHSIPNAWMASTPFHPFFLLPLEAISEEMDVSESVEKLTGPVALHDQISRYQVQYHSGTELVSYLRHTQMNHVYFDQYELRHSIHILPPDIIYPFPWDEPDWLPASTVHHCYANHPDFDRSICKEELEVWEKGAHCITFWAHSW